MIFRTTNSNEELVHLIVQKKHAALERLYNLYAPALYSVILKILPDQQVATEALQQTFLAIWHSADEYDFEKERLYTWLHRKAIQAATRTHSFTPIEARVVA